MVVSSSKKLTIEDSQYCEDNSDNGTLSVFNGMVLNYAILVIESGFVSVNGEDYYSHYLEGLGSIYANPYRGGDGINAINGTIIINGGKLSTKGEQCGLQEKNKNR